MVSMSKSTSGLSELAPWLDGTDSLCWGSKDLEKAHWIRTGAAVPWLLVFCFCMCLSGLLITDAKLFKASLSMFPLSGAGPTNFCETAKGCFLFRRKLLKVHQANNYQMTEQRSAVIKGKWVSWCWVST